MNKLTIIPLLICFISANLFANSNDFVDRLSEGKNVRSIYREFHNSSNYIKIDNLEFKLLIAPFFSLIYEKGSVAFDRFGTISERNYASSIYPKFWKYMSEIIIATEINSFKKEIAKSIETVQCNESVYQIKNYKRKEKDSVNRILIVGNNNGTFIKLFNIGADEISLLIENNRCGNKIIKAIKGIYKSN